MGLKFLAKLNLHSVPDLICIRQERVLSDNSSARQCFSQHERSVLKSLRRSIFLRPVTHSITAWNEEHGRRTNATHEKRIVIRTADHVLISKALLAAGVHQEVYKSWIAGSWRVLIDGGDRRTDSAARGDCVGSCSKSRITSSRRCSSMSRISSSRSTRLGMLFTRPGKIRQTPHVATVSIAPVDLARSSSVNAISAAAAKASCRSGIRTPPACPPSPSIVTRRLAGAAMCVTTPIAMFRCSSNGPVQCATR